MSPTELLFLFSLIGGLILPFLFLQGAGRWFWVGTMSTVGLVVCGGELASKLSTGHSISQHFWIFSQSHPHTAWIVLGLLLLGWISLLAHLACKMLSRKK